MRILLIGEYSRLHYTLAEGLRILGHDVVVASDGDLFKNYPRDIDLTRKSSGFIDTLSCTLSSFYKFSHFKGFDIVQLINPCFVTLNIHLVQYLYKMLKANNKKIFLGAFGDDSYWVRACLTNKILKYSEFFVDGHSTNLDYNKVLTARWIDSKREAVNKEIATSCDGIIACLYEYYKSYEPYFSHKLKYIPLPLNTMKTEYSPIDKTPDRVNFFIGINRDRSEYKGTDRMTKVLFDVAQKYPNEVIVTKAESVSYDEYQVLMSQSHIVLDQLYSYSPAMNALLAMGQGRIVVGGGEPEIYDLLGEKENHPIVNVFPSEKDIFDKLEYLVLNKDVIPKLSRRGRLFVEQHHDYIAVARQYLEFWNSK